MLPKQTTRPSGLITDLIIAAVTSAALFLAFLHSI